MSFLDEINKITNIKSTENGGRAYKSTGGGELLDLFSSIGGLRDNPKKAIEMWKIAREEDKELADNLILYTRNIRDGGLGERELGRQLILELSKIDPTKVVRNLSTIVENGRWDDILVLLDTPIFDEVIVFIQECWQKDIKDMLDNKPISLLAKWLPSPNTHSKKTRAAARKIYHALHLNEKVYRKALSKMRGYIDVVEKKMSLNKWNEIDFEKVPSNALHIYQNAYLIHSPENFTKYVEKVKTGETKINSSTLYPYDICRKWFVSNNFSDVDELQWKALPDYIGEEYNILIMADVSGSMTCLDYRPIATSIGLATYFAQRNKGAYHNTYLTFSSEPRLIKIEDGYSLDSIFRKVSETDIGYGTDFDKAMEAIYVAAAQSNEVPDALVVISDEEIDYYTNQTNYDIFDKWDLKFKEAGFKGCPKIVFWNVESSRNITHLATANQNVSYVSGYGIGPFKQLNSLITKSAYEAMVEILSKFQWK